MQKKNRDRLMIPPAPQFIIGGAPRSGTTWIYELLNKHPEIYMAKPVRPEPKFFLVDDLYERGFSYYQSTWFNGLEPGRMAGEKSTNYLENPAVAARINQHLPHVKLIFILREPADRAFSNYRWSVMNGYETHDFATALSLEEERERTLAAHLRFVRPHAYFSRGLYAELLKPFFSLFSQKQILCLRYEDLRDQPEIPTRLLHRFLEVEFRPHDADGLSVINASVKESEGMTASLRSDLQLRYMEPNRALAALLGPDFKVWK